MFKLLILVFIVMKQVFAVTFMIAMLATMAVVTAVEILPEADAKKKASGTYTKKYGSATKGVVCGDRLCSEVGKDVTPNISATGKYMNQDYDEYMKDDDSERHDGDMKEHDEYMKDHDSERHDGDMKEHDEYMKDDDSERHDGDMKEHDEYMKDDDSERHDGDMKEHDEYMKDDDSERHDGDMKEHDEYMKDDDSERHDGDMKEHDEYMKDHDSERHDGDMKEHDEYMKDHDSERHDGDMKEHDEYMKDDDSERHDGDMKEHDEYMKDHDSERKDRKMSETITGAVLKSNTLDSDSGTITIVIESFDDGIIKIDTSQLDSIDMIIVDGEEWDDVHIYQDKVKVYFKAGAEKIEIIGNASS